MPVYLTAVVVNDTSRRQPSLNNDKAINHRCYQRTIWPTQCRGLNAVLPGIVAIDDAVGAGVMKYFDL